MNEDILDKVKWVTPFYVNIMCVIVTLFTIESFGPSDFKR